MALSVINQLTRNLQKLRLEPKVVSCSYYTKSKYPMQPRFRPPHWWVKKERVTGDDMLTRENRDFIKEVIDDRYGAVNRVAAVSPLAGVETTEVAPWDPKTRRCGLVCRKIGVYPMWLKSGKKVMTTLLQVVDNHIIRYTPPENLDLRSKTRPREMNRLGALLVGSQTIDPTVVTKEYFGQFKDTGLLPKKRICRFLVTPNAAMPVGTPLYASHFRVGDVVDIRAKTIDRGFQGVMKRWNFKGMPASHGVTKTHRRPGNIGGGGQKARVWPGKKMPGHMGNNMRTHRGVSILRINNKYNVIWAKGLAIPGEIGALCYVYDTKLPLRKPKTAPPFPTYYPTGDEPEEVYDESVHQFHDPTLIFPEE